MSTRYLLTFAALFALGCTSLGEAGESCESDADCADGLECHKEEHDHEGEEEEGEHEDEAGVCEEEGAHDDHDHEGE